MHGHQLRLIAEKEHIDEWTDISVGALYGALKRLAIEGLVTEVRHEKEGAYPERAVYGITHEGHISLGSIRLKGLQDVVVRTDPFDLAMTSLDRNNLDQVEPLLRARRRSIEELLQTSIAHTETIRQYLSVGEHVVMQHKSARIRAELEWLDELLAQLPAILADESTRKGH